MFIGETATMDESRWDDQPTDESYKVVYPCDFCLFG